MSACDKFEQEIVKHFSQPTMILLNATTTMRVINVKINAFKRRRKTIAKKQVKTVNVFFNNETVDHSLRQSTRDCDGEVLLKSELIRAMN